MYGLKQSSHAWFGKFSQAVEKFGMQKSKFDHSIFCRNSSSGIILLVVYVDDIVIIESDSKSISSLKSFLHGQFHTVDLGMLRYFLGVEVMRSKHGIFLSQGHMFLIYCLRLESLRQSHVVPLWLQVYTLLEKTSWNIELPYSNLS